MKSAAAGAQKWGAGLTNAINSGTWKAGVESVTQAPGVKAAQRQAEYVAGVQASAAVWAKNVQVPLATWQADTVNKGQQRISQAATSDVSKVEQVLSKILAAEASIVPGLPARGVAGSANNVQRMTAFAAAMHARKGQFKATA